MRSVRRCSFVLALVLALPSVAEAAWSCGGGPAPPPDGGPHMIVVVGAPGTPEFGVQFDAWAARWQETARALGGALQMIGRGEAGEGDKQRLKAALGARAAAADGAPLWLVFLGHGTYGGERAKFNLRGADVSARELADWMEPVQGPALVAVCASCSGPFVNRLSRPGRVLISATKSGQEYSFSRFGGPFSAAFTDPAADLDKDDQVSALEAFLYASAGVEEFYAREARLATEHALIDDNGDGLGTPASWFDGVRVVRRARDDRIPDGPRAHQVHLAPSEVEGRMPAEVRARRDELEIQIEGLRLQRDRMGEEEYLAALQALLVSLAELYERLDEDTSPE